MRPSNLFLALVPMLVACGGVHEAPRDAGGMEATLDAGASDGAVADAASPADAGPPDDTADPEALAAAYRREACATARRCESIIGRSQDVFCHPDYRSPMWEELLAAWRAGRASYDPVAARACLDAITAERCGAFVGHIDPPPPECRGVILGTVPEGGECARGSAAFSAQCEPGLDCVVEAACPGRCARRGRVGDACSRFRRCEGSLRCLDGECVAYPNPGEPCSPGMLCGPNGDTVCYDGICALEPDLGEPCGEGIPRCQHPFRCRADASGAEVCAEVLGTEEGDYCQQLRSGCDYPLICVEIDHRPEPDTDGACTRGVELGATCDDATPCAPGGRCVEGRCVEIVDPARPCDREHVCPTTHECTAGECVPRPTTGDACDTRRCAFSSCLEGVCESRFPGESEPCRHDAYECDFGLECRGDAESSTCRAPCP